MEVKAKSTTPFSVLTGRLAAGILGASVAALCGCGADGLPTSDAQHVAGGEAGGGKRSTGAQQAADREPPGQLAEGEKRSRQTHSTPEGGLNPPDARAPSTREPNDDDDAPAREAPHFVAADDSKLADEQMRRGLAQQRVGEFAGAVATYTAILHRNEQYVTALANRAICYEALGQLDNAIIDYGKAVSQLGPSLQSELLVMRSLCHVDRKSYALAEADLRRAIELKGSNGLAWLGLGLTEHLLGRAAQSEKAVRTAISLDPECVPKLLRRDIVKSSNRLMDSMAPFLAEFEGHNDPQRIRDGEAWARWVDVMGSGYWDVDGRFKFYGNQ